MFLAARTGGAIGGARASRDVVVDSPAPTRARALRLTMGWRVFRACRRRKGEQGLQGGQVCEEGFEGEAFEEAILRDVPQVRVIDARFATICVGSRVVASVR